MNVSIEGGVLGGSVRKNTTDQLLSALSRKYEEKSSQRSTSSSRNTPQQSRDGRPVFSGRSSILDNPSPVNYGLSGKSGIDIPTARRASSPFAGHGRSLSPVLPTETSSIYTRNHVPASHASFLPAGDSRGSAPGDGRLSRGSSHNTSVGRDADRLRFSSRHDRIVSPSTMDEEVRSNHSHPSEMLGSKDGGRSPLVFSQVLGSPRMASLVAGSSPPHIHATEKDVMEAVMRKLEVENSSLKAENKVLKEKYSRSLADAAQLEGKLRSVDEDNIRLQAELKKERASMRSRSADDRAHSETRALSNELVKKLDSLKVENESLQQELAASRRLAQGITNHGDSSSVVAMFKEESELLREEVKKIKLLLRQCEKDLADEAELHRKTLEEKKRLEDANAILKEQLEMDGGSGGTVADKQTKSIEKRLKITEERLFQERADRAGKLSEVEEKLLTENAQLQIEVKELNRYLNREREKLKALEVKLTSLKEQQRSIDFLTATSSTRRYTPAQKNPHSKFSPDVTRIAEEVGRTQSVSIESTDELIKHLYSREQLAVQRVNDWKSELDELKELSSRSSEQAAEAARLREAADELSGRLQQTEATFNGKVSKLVKEKHDMTAKLKTCEDQMEGMQAELDGLRSQLRRPSGSGAGGAAAETADKLLEYQLELKDTRVRLSQAERECNTLRAELDGTARLLEARSRAAADADAAASALVKLRADVSRLTEANSALVLSKQEMEARLEKAERELLSESRSFLQCQQDGIDAHRHAEAMAMLKAAKADLSMDLEVTSFKLAELQSRAADQQREIAGLKDRDKALTEERDRLLREKHDALVSVAQIEAQFRQAASEHEQQLREARRELKAQRKQLKAAVGSHAVELRKIGAEKEALGRRLESKEKELQRHEQSSRTLLADKVSELHASLDDSRRAAQSEVASLETAVEKHDRRLVAHELHAASEQQWLLRSGPSAESLESRLRLLEIELDESKVREMKARSELIAAEDAKNKLGEQADRLAASLAVESEHRESSVAGIQAVVDELNEELIRRRFEHEHSVKVMQDKLDRASADLRAAEETVTAVVKTKEYLQATAAALEKKVDQQSHELALRQRLMDQRSESAHCEMEESRSYAKATEQRMADLQALLSRAESDHKSEREKMLCLQQNQHDLEAQVASRDAQVHNLQKELEQAQKEAKASYEKADSVYQQLTSKYKAQVAEMKKHQSESDRSIRQLQKRLAQQSAELEDERRQSTAAALAEQAGQSDKTTAATTALEGRLSDALTRLKQAEESLAAQDEQQDTMKRRNLELEVELTELRGLLSRLDTNVPTTASDPKIDNLTRAELNRTMQEWSARLQALFESQRSKEQSGVGGSEHELGRLQHEQCKLKVVELEGKLKHEQLMHTLTRNQLKAADDDNAKLRKLLYGGRRKRGTDEGSLGRSRAELINEKIAAAQLRAQMMMSAASSASSAASVYADDGGAGTTPLGSLLLGSSLLATPPRFERLNNAMLHNNMSAGSLDKD